MMKKFLNYDPLVHDSVGRYEEPPFEKELYFFYGTLMDPTTLSKVLGTDKMPETKPARVFGRKCKLWGLYPALVDEFCKEAVHGVAYEVQSVDEKQKLVDYEGAHYVLIPSPIYLDDDTWVWGCTFMWNGDESCLTEGAFDLEGWKKRVTECMYHLLSVYAWLSN
jgi:gamma-glutamylcyclotransferase (GGCT)/AIG2-like uncharacterized protein YtfP